MYSKIVFFSDEIQKITRVKIWILPVDVTSWITPYFALREQRKNLPYIREDQQSVPQTLVVHIYRVPQQVLDGELFKVKIWQN